MNRNVIWKIVLILAVMVVFTVAIIPTKNNPQPIKRGLDLKGGIHLVMRVNVNEAARLEVDQAMNTLRTQATAQNLPAPTARRISDTTFVATLPANTPTGGYERIATDYLPTFELTRAGNDLRFTLKAQNLKDLERDTVAQAVEAIRRRVDALGVAEPVIVPEGEDRIVIQLPGVDDPARVKDIIKTTAQLQFRLVENGTAPTAQALYEQLPANIRSQVDILPGNQEDELGRVTGTLYYAVQKNIPVSGRDLKNARVQKGQVGEPVIGFTLTPEGAPKFGQLTGNNVGRQLAIVLDNKVVSAPRINSQITDEGVIEGTFTQQQAADLALILRSGSLPASLTTLEERTVGPSLGRDSIRQGFMATAVGFLLLVLAIIAYYKGAGINAVLALLLNLIILLGMMAYFGAALTLPGIAGIVLTLGMAVDSNVLVFERIREELREGKTARASIDQGFARAFATIIDTHLTTIISALFLFQFGTGPIQGFAVTLCVGILTSMFTAIMGSRALLTLMYGGRRKLAALPI
ncbi:MAG TPA: protein translocase subunit SecD [Thermoanaerobaculia bacterium]|nr:protein translocase subunit SecD [Thermoanaerobaculia bacterium]